MKAMEKISKNFILNTDSYKCSHWKQYPDNTTKVYSYIESRGGEFDATVFFGLQAYLKEYLSGPVITMDDINFAEKFLSQHGEPFNKEGWVNLLNKYGGHLPIIIRAVKEGTVVPTSNILLSIENTDPEFYWLTSYVETSLLRAIWYPTTVATLSWNVKKEIKRFMEETCDTLDGLPFKLHDFGARGVSSLESAALGGMSHLINFMGTDTLSGAYAAMEYYGGDMPGFSVPAAEHSTMTILGREGEYKQFERMLDQFAAPGKIVACVSDSYDIMAACDVWGTTLKQKIIDSGCVLVVRPDSGTPEIVCLNVVQRLDKHFGHIVNSKGYKVLHPSVRVIYGDGINLKSIHSILFALKMAGYSTDNVVFGMGGALLQQINRDTQKFAMKASYAEVNGEMRNVFKDPIGDSVKKSKAGRMIMLRDTEGNFKTQSIDIPYNIEWTNMLETVFVDGEIVRTQSFKDVREIANSYL